MTPQLRPVTSVRALATKLCEQYSPVHEVRLQLGSWGCVVRTNDEPLAVLLRDYFAEFVAKDGATAGRPNCEIYAIECDSPDLGLEFAAAPLEAGKTRPKEAIAQLADGRVIHKVRTGMHFATADGINLAFGPCRANDNQVVNFVNNRQIQHYLERGAYLAHASALTTGTRSVAIAGFAGAGKSTTALHAMRELDAVALLSNDRVMISATPAGLVATGVPKHPRINPGTILGNPSLHRILSAEELATFSAMSPDELWPLEHKFDGRVDHCFGPGRFVLEAPLTAFMVLTWTRDGGSCIAKTVRIADQPQLLAAIMKSPGVFFAAPSGYRPRTEDDYIALLGDLPILWMSGGIDFDHAVAVLQQHLLG